VSSALRAGWSTLFPYTTLFRSESLGLVGLEAMSCGTPVIASNMAGPQTYIVNGMNGFLFSPGNSKELAQYIKKYFAMTADQKTRSEEHTSELQSRENLVCRLLL